MPKPLLPLLLALSGGAAWAQSGAAPSDIADLLHGAGSAAPFELGDCVPPGELRAGSCVFTTDLSYIAGSAGLAPGTDLLALADLLQSETMGGRLLRVVVTAMTTDPERGLAPERAVALAGALRELGVAPDRMEAFGAVGLMDMAPEGGWVEREFEGMLTEIEILPAVLAWPTAPAPETPLTADDLLARFLFPGPETLIVLCGDIPCLLYRLGQSRRGLCVGDCPPPPVMRETPAANLQLDFADGGGLGARGRANLEALAAALADPRLEGRRVLVTVFSRQDGEDADRRTAAVAGALAGLGLGPDRTPVTGYAPSIANWPGFRAPLDRAAPYTEVWGRAEAVLLPE